MKERFAFSWIAFVWVAAGLVGCRASTGPERGDASGTGKVRVYCSVDEPFARTVFAEFERRTGIRVEALLDTEAGKTTGLVNRIRAERSRPRADVLWSSEIFSTILLAREGLLAAYVPDTAGDIPARYRDSEARWTAIGLRGRVVVYDSARTRREEVPKRWADLADERWHGLVAMANPQFGTTRGQVSSWFALWGEERARAFLERLAEMEVVIADGNSSVVRQVISGRAELGLTDTDDVWVAQRRHPSLELAYPDMGEGGTLWIPNTVALVSGAGNSETARRLIDFLVSADVEEMLARSDSRNIPVRASVRKRLGIELPGASEVSYERVADEMEGAISAAREILLR